MKIQKELVDKTREIYSFFNDERNILAYGYHGSVSKGYCDRFSDLDILIITKGKLNFPSIEGKLKNLDGFERFGTEEKPNYHFNFEGTTATIGFGSVDEIKKDIDSANNQKDIGALKRLRILRDYKVLFGDKGRVANLIEQIDFRLPEDYVKKEFEGLYQWVVNNVKPEGRLDIEIKRKNWISFEYRFARTYGWTMQLIYAINNTLFLDARWASKEIANFKLVPKDCIKRLDKIAKLGNGEKSSKMKLKLMREFVIDFDKIARKRFHWLMKV